MQNRKQNLIRIIDMHAHLLCLSEEYRERLTEQEMLALGMQELAARREYGIDAVFSCGTPQEWEFMRQCLAQSERAIQEAGREEEQPPGQVAGKADGNFSLSFGIHPWYSDRFDPRDCREYFQACPIIGEIGMDSVWCEIPLDVQRRAFAQQLEIAAELGKPVVLHTKGQESQIAEIIRDFPGKVCVHWYSGSEADFEKFLEAGCYFTLGPDLAERFASQEDTELWSERTAAYLAGQDAMAYSTALYRRMLREIPAERLFLETDGLSSIAWMRGQETGAVSFRDIPAVLEKNLKFVAKEKQIQPGQLRACLKENFHELTS